MKSKLNIAAFISAATLMAAAAQAQETRPDCALRVATGPSGKVYELALRDMQAVCGSTVSLCSVASSGGLQNLSHLAANEAELAMVQVDTLKEMSSGDESIRSLQAVLPMHANLLHILAATEGSMVGVKTLLGKPVPGTGDRVVLRQFSDLKGMVVAAVGSAHVMGQALERQLAYGMKFVMAENDEHALSLLKQGQVQAVFTLGGWPLPTISRLRVSSGVHLVDFNLEARSPHIAVKRNYQNLDALNFNFLGVPNVLVTRPFKVGGAMANKVAALQSCMRQRLDELQEGRYQALWKEIKDPAQAYGVTAFLAAPKGVQK